MNLKKKLCMKQLKMNLKRNNSLYRCPHCEKIIEWNDANYNPEESTYICQKCKNTFEESELEALSMFEILEEMFIAFKEKYDE